MSEKETKVRFFTPNNLENHTSEGKGKEKKKRARRRKGGEEKKKRSVATWEMERSFWPKNKLFNGRGLFGGKVFKNPARDKEEFKHELVITSNK